MSVQALMASYNVLGPASITCTVNNGSDGATSTVYTFSGKSIGTASGRKAISFAATGMNTPTSATATVGGVSATIIKTTTTSVGNAVCLVVFSIPNSSLSNPSATTDDFVITFNSSSGGCNLVVHAVYNSTTAVSTSQSSTSNSASTAITTSQDCPAGGAIVGYAAFGQSGSDPTGSTWTNITETADFQVSAPSNRMWESAGALAFSAAQTGLTITMTPSNTEGECMATASYGPG